MSGVGKKISVLLDKTRTGKEVKKSISRSLEKYGEDQDSNHFLFSFTLKKLSLLQVQKRNSDWKDCVIGLVKEWIKVLDFRVGKIDAANISGTYNSLSKLNILDRTRWNDNQKKQLKSLIIKLAERGKDIYQNFNSRDIANSLNALSKWNNEELEGADEFIVKLIKQGNEISEEFNSQAIANSLNALSKWNNEELEGANKFIVKLIEQGNGKSKQFNSQAIANSLNALSKWTNEELEGAAWKEFVVKLIKQGNGKSKQFNSQEIANSLNALSKWTNEELEGADEFIVKLIEQGNDKSKQFNSQEIANSLNALSKWDVLSNVWKGSVQVDNKSVKKIKLRKAFIEKLVGQGNVLLDKKETADKFNSQEIANSLNTLSKWTNEELEGAAWKEFIIKLIKQGNDKSKQFNSQHIANSLNALSKWTNEELEGADEFIVKLIEQGNGKSKQFNSQHIANSLNALSKWDVLSNVWKGSVQVDNKPVKKIKLRKAFIEKLVGQGNVLLDKKETADKFNSQEIANSLNALSKWNSENLKGAGKFTVKLIKQGNKTTERFNSQHIANSLNALSKWTNEELEGADEFIVKLIEQGNGKSKQFNSQDIANSLNALSKWSNENFDRADKFIVELIKQGNKTTERFNSQHIANSLNVLSKWNILDKKRWKRDELNESKNFIVKLIEQGNEISEEFNSQEIANSLNALSKWTNEELEGAAWKEFVVKLIKQGSEQSKQFNSQAIANSLNALSKWNILDKKRWKEDELNEFKNFIVKLIEQGNEISEEFNSQEIANSLNALSKWNSENLKGAGKFTVKLIKQGNKTTERFNSQHIANSFDALYKFNILDSSKWDTDKCKSFVVNLAEKGKEVYTEFNSQNISNTFNAFSKLGILDDSRWTSKEQNKLKPLIINLASVDETYKNYNLKDISKTYSALSQWNVVFNDKFDPDAKDKFLSLISKLEKRVLAIAGEQSVVEPGIDMRFASQMIKDLQKLKSRSLVTSDSQLLIPLMQCLSVSIDRSKVSDLSEHWTKENILSGLTAFCEIVSKLENQSALKDTFDKNLITIFNKLSTAKLDDDYISEISNIATKLMKSEIIKDDKYRSKIYEFRKRNTNHEITAVPFERGECNEDLQDQEVSQKRKETLDIEHPDILNARYSIAAVSEEQKNVCAIQFDQKALRKAISNLCPKATIKAVTQNLYLPDLNGVEMRGRCAAVTRGLSQALFLGYDRSFVDNLKASAKVYKRKAQNKQISEREEIETFAFSKLLNDFEGQRDSDKNSLPSSLIHNKSYKTFSDLSNYIAGIKGDFAIHLVASNQVIAVYRRGVNHAYFDSDVAFVSDLESVNQLMKVMKETVKIVGYKVEEKGFFVEHFDVNKANKLLSRQNKTVLKKEIKTEYQLLKEQDKKRGRIKINGQEISRVQLYDFGTKISMEGGVPLLINASMNLSSKKFQEHLDRKEVSMTARDYLDSLKNGQNMEEVVQATKVIPFIGSGHEIEEAEQIRKPKQSLQSGWFVQKMISSIVNSFINVFCANTSQSESQLPEITFGTEGSPEPYLSDVAISKESTKTRSPGSK